MSKNSQVGRGDILIGIDAGTSVIKAVAFDLSGTQLDSAAIPNRYVTTADGAATQSLAQTWSDCAKALHDLGGKIPKLSRRTVALAVTAQGDGTWLVGQQPPGRRCLALARRARRADGRAAAAQPRNRARFEATGTGLNTCQQGSQLAHMASHPAMLASQSRGRPPLQGLALPEPDRRPRDRSVRGELHLRQFPRRGI